MRASLLLALLVAVPAAAQAPDSSAVGGPTFEPLQTSAPVAYLASVGATGLLVGTGLLLDAALGAPPESAYADGTDLLYDVGSIVAVVGVLLGPSVGNLTLGAGDDVGRAYVVKAGGVAVGGGLFLVALATTGACFVSQAGGCPGAQPLFVASVGAVVVGVAAGTVYDLATIPRNAARARGAHRAVTLWPTGAGLALRVGL